MSQNLVEKLQEIWNNLQQQPAAQKVSAKLAEARQQKTVAAVEDGLKKAGQKVRRFWRKNHMNLRLSILLSAVVSSGPVLSKTGTSNSGSRDKESPNTEIGVSPTMRQLQVNLSQEELGKICSQMLSDDLTYNQICSERSAETGDALLSIASEVQKEIKSKGRSRVLRSRWGKDVPVGLHCLRSALEVLNEAAQQSGAPEFADAFIQKVRACNPNSYYGLKKAFGKHRNYRKTTAKKNLLALIKEETAKNPDDILMIAQKSSGNRTGSGYHMVLVYHDTVISFNRERIASTDSYFRYTGKQGDMINVSRTAREDAREDIVRSTVNDMMAELQNGKPENLKALLAQYMSIESIPLEDRLMVGKAVQDNTPLIADLTPVIDPVKNLEHLRKVRAKMDNRDQKSKTAVDSSTKRSSLANRTSQESGRENKVIIRRAGRDLTS